MWIDRQTAQLKGEYLEVKKLHSLSGFGWDDDLKVVTASPDVWERYLKVRLQQYLLKRLIYAGQRHTQRPLLGAKNHSPFMM